MSFPKYPAYKDSGVEWIGKIPVGWKIGSIKNGYQVTLGKMLSPKENFSKSQVKIPYLRSANVQDGFLDIQDIKEMFFSQSEISLLSIKIGDVLVCEGGDIGRSVLINKDMPETGFQNSLNRIRSKYNCTKYFYYFSKLVKSSGYLDILCNKSTIQHYTFEKLSNTPFVYPTLSEQQAIASFLDRECGKIDALIAEQERLIALLAEKRKAVISHAVTKGLNPNVPMKDSGIPWIGKVPEGWEVLRFSRLVAISEGQIDPKREQYASMILIAPNHIESETGRLREMNTAAEQNAESGKYIYEVGTVLYSKIRPALAKVAIAPVRGLCSADMYALTSRGQLNQLYLAWVMLTSSFTAWAIMESDRVAMPKINREKLNEVMLPLPPFPEQAAISDYIKNKTTQIDELVKNSKFAIKILKERRSALISAAVTGKIDVRNQSKANAA